MDLFESAHVTYTMLATELLQNPSNDELLNAVARFADELASSGDELLEELLVIDVLEGIAQDSQLAIRLSARLGERAAAFLREVERGYYKRDWR